MPVASLRNLNDPSLTPGGWLDEEYSPPMSERDPQDPPSASKAAAPDETLLAKAFFPAWVPHQTLGGAAAETRQTH